MLIGTVPSPPLELRPPARANPEGIAAGIRDEQTARWRDSGRAAGEVEVHRHLECWLGPRGLVLESDGSPVDPRSGHTSAEVDAGREAMSENRTDTPRIEGPAILLGGLGHTAYGHWLVEILPALRIVAEVTEIGDRKALIPRVPNVLLNTYLAALEALGVERVETFRNVWFRCEDLITVGGLASIDKSVSPLVKSTFEAIAETVEPASGPDRLFLSRQAFSGRKVADFAAIEPVLEAHELDVIEPERMPFAEQVSRFRSAQLIVGPMGSALTGMCFAPSGATVLALAPTGMLDSFFWMLANLCGHEYLELRCPVTGPSSTGRGWDRDLDLDPETLDRWLATASAGDRE